MHLTRRAVLTSGAAGGLAACATIGRGGRMPPLGLADITVQRELTHDYAATLRQVAAMGYSHFGFRLSGYGPASSELPTREKAQIVRDAGLEIGVVRFGVRGVNYAQQIEQAVAIGAKTVAMTVSPVFIASQQLGQASRTAFEAWLPQLATLGAQCRAAGLTLAYHNHWWDVMPLEGESPLETMLRSISPGDLSFEVDLAWCWYGGIAPLELIARLGPRVASMHLKDIDRSIGKGITDHAVVIGSGEMRYARLLPRLPKLTGAIGYIEVDSPPDGLAAAAQGATFFRQVMRG